MNGMPMPVLYFFGIILIIYFIGIYAGSRKLSF